ncbi:MAG: thiamine diphosphokinase [Holosporales bacterium]
MSIQVPESSEHNIFVCKEFCLDRAIEVILLANGEPPSQSQTAWLREQTQPLVLTDGAANWAKEQGVTPAAIVGDFDSLNNLSYWQTQSVEIHHDPDQNTNDLHKALRAIHQQGWRRVLILGLHGRRSDHMLANIFFISQWLPLLQLSWLDHHGLGWIAAPEEKLEAVRGRAVSLFALGDRPVTGLTTRGLVYPLDQAVLKPYTPAAALNVMQEDTAWVRHQTGTLLIYQAFQS